MQLRRIGIGTSKRVQPMEIDLKIPVTLNYNFKNALPVILHAVNYMHKFQFHIFNPLQLATFSRRAEVCLKK